MSLSPLPQENTFPQFVIAIDYLLPAAAFVTSNATIPSTSLGSS